MRRKISRVHKYNACYLLVSQNLVKSIKNACSDLCDMICFQKTELSNL